MDADGKGSCPPLPVFSFHDNLVASSLSNAVGSLIEFVCGGEEDLVLSGSSVLLCTSAGKWNGSIPTCIDKDEVTSSTLPYTTETPEPETVEDAGLKLNAVIIVLWITGGLILITLSVFIGCILRTHKKRRRNRSERAPRGQGNPRHGGVNPTFSNYDEIWTWIPVLTDNDGNCRNQPNGANTRREVSASQSNNELMRNLRLPTYTEAITGTTVVTSPSHTRNRPIYTVPSNQRNNAPSRQNNNRQNVSNVTQSANQRPTQLNVRESRTERQNTRPQVHRTVVNVRETRAESCARSGQHRNSAQTNNPSLTEQHHYETIPADYISRSSVPTNRESTSRVYVTTSSGSALQQARDLVNQYSAHAQRPQPSAPAQDERIRELSRDLNTRSQNATTTSYTNPSREHLRNVCRSQIPESRHSSYYPPPQTQHEFRHSEGSRFEYYADNGDRIRSNIPVHRTSEPPPPYSVARDIPSRPSGSSGRQTSGMPSAAAESSLYTGLECQYF